MVEYVVYFNFYFFIFNFHRFHPVQAANQSFDLVFIPSLMPIKDPESLLISSTRIIKLRSLCRDPSFCRGAVCLCAVTEFDCGRSA